MTASDLGDRPTGVPGTGLAAGVVEPSVITVRATGEDHVN